MLALLDTLFGKTSSRLPDPLAHNAPGKSPHPDEPTPDLAALGVDAGALALSKDSGRSDLKRPNFGCGFHCYRSATLDPRLRVFSVSQEHGWLTGHHPVGERFRILPQHSCLTAAHFDEFVVVRGDEIVDRWKILRGRD